MSLESRLDEFRATLADVIEQNRAKSVQATDRYFDGVDKVVAKTADVLTKLPSGERVSRFYAERATRAVAAQRKATGWVIEKQNSAQTWPLRASAKASHEAA